MTDAEARSVLLIDDDRPMRERVASTLERAGYRVVAVRDRDREIERETVHPHDVVLASVGTREARIRSLKKLLGPLPLVVLCEVDQVPLAISALRQGASDYLLRPPDPVELETRLERLLERQDLDSRLAFFQDELSKRAHKKLEVRSPAMRAVQERLLRVAPLRSTVLIFGESGVGKELVARSIHFNSPRRNGPFMALNCAAIPASLIESELFGHEKGSFTGAHARVRGKFEIADRGTLFLDEIGEMAPATQAKLLRVLEQKEFMRIGGDRSVRVDARVIGATNADLEALVADGGFRRDLYYRLKVITIDVPPLRERRPDIPALIETFLDDLSRSNAVERRPFTPEALVALQAYHWPGNVRELKNLVESLLVSTSGEAIGLEDLPQAVAHERFPVETSDLTPGATLADVERELIRRTLEFTGGNRTHSATLLGIGVRTLQRKIRSYGLTIPPTRRRRRRSSTNTRATR
jgi:DNA-binding NtrC family response regulator